MRIQHTYISSVFYFLLITSVSYAQTEKVSQEIRYLTTVWEKHYPVSDSVNYLSPADVFNFIRVSPVTNKSSQELQSDIKKAEAENYRHDPGLDVSANYLENFNPGLGEDDDNLIYNRRIQAGLNWQILNNGWIENRMLADKTENELWLDNQHHFSYDKKAYAEQWNRILYLFNTEKLKWLDVRKGVLGDLEKSTSDLYLLKFITREDYLEILTRKTEVESMYRIFADYNQAFEKLSDTVLQKVEQFPVFDIRYDSILLMLEYKNTLNDSAAMLFAENLEIEKSLLRDINLSTSLRYNYYNLVTDNPPTRNFLTFGLNFSMPIPFNLQQKRKLAEARADYSRYVFENSGEEFHREVLNDCYEYRYKLKQYESFCQKQNLMEEKLRKYNALKDIHDLDFNPVEALNVLDEYLAVKIELIDITQNLYLKFLRINSYFSNAWNEKFTSAFSHPEGYELDDAIERSVYIWSSALEKYSPVFIREYLVYNKFERAVISVNENDSVASKVNKLMELLQARNIQVDLMIGENKLIEQGDILAAIDSRTKNITNSFSGLHLDIEPHTFSDWDTRKAEYLQKYLAMLQKVRTWCDTRKIELSVSIPLHYPEETVKEIFSLCDKVYFMAYENTKPDYIQRKTEVFKDQKEKRVMAVSVKDFENRPLLEQQLMELYRITGFTSFAVHDFSRLAAMDEANIEGKE